jgi:DNA repair exonuclease SbcCD ATPase subunit
MVIPASAQNISDEDAKIREEIRACWIEVDANEDFTVAEKTVAKRNCETVINNKYSEMNNNHYDLAEEKERIEVMQKCEDWYPSYKLLDEDQWRIQKHADQASDCLMIYNDDIWKYDGEDRLVVLSDMLIELKEEQNQRPTPVATFIEHPSESSIIAQDTRLNKMVELEAKVVELEEQVRKKDAIIMEQIKVLTDLANMIRNVILNVFVPNGILF